jgi:cysteine desulfuration protein SufE
MSRRRNAEVARGGKCLDPSLARRVPGLRSFSMPCGARRTEHAGGVPLTRKLQQLVDDLAVLDDPQERLGLIVDRAKRHPPLPPGDRIDAHRVRGCVSVVWLVGELRDGLCYFRGDAESPVVRGLVALLCEFFSGFPPATITAGAAVDPIETLGIARSLSPTRRNGLESARAAIRAFAEKNV